MQNKTSLIMYTTEDGITRIQATFDEDTVWHSFSSATSQRFHGI